MLVIVCAVASTVYGHVPDADRVQKAIAENNVSSGRQQAVRLEMNLQMGERMGVAHAELISHPTGLARLELRGAGHIVERHLLQGSELTVSRNGELLEKFRTFLLPFFILQSESALQLRAALETFSVQVDLVGLAECGEYDCLVLGDPQRVVPRPEVPPIAGLESFEPEAELDEASGDEADLADEPAMERGPAPPVDEAEREPVARLWVDAQSYDVRGIDFENGVSMRLGPVVVFDKLRVPAWILIEEPGKATARFDVLRASQVNAPASAFTREWLLAPIERPTSLGGAGGFALPPGE